MAEDRLVTLLKQTNSESFRIEQFGNKESAPKFIVLVRTNNIDKLVEAFTNTEFKIESSEQLAVFNENPIIKHVSSAFKEPFVEFRATKKVVVPQKTKHNNFKKTSFRQQNYKKKNNYIATKSMRI